MRVMYQKFGGIVLRTWIPVGAILAMTFLLHSHVWIPSGDSALDEVRKPRADLMLFYAGALLIRESPERLYDVSRQAEAQREATGLGMSEGDIDFLPYLYPPIVGLAYVPLTFVSYKSAYLLSILLNFILLGSGLAVLSSGLRLNLEAAQVLSLCATACLAVYATLLEGQVSFWFLLLYALMIVNLRNGNPDRAGIWAGLLAFKFQLLPVWLFWFAVRRHWRALGYALGIAGVIAGVSMLLVGVDGSSGYFRLSRQVMAGNFFAALPQDTPNLRALTYFFNLGDTVWIAAVALVLLALYKRPPSRDWEYCMIVIAALLAAPYIQISECVVLLIVVGLVLSQQAEKVSVAARWSLFALMLWQSVERWLFGGPGGSHWPGVPLTLAGSFIYVTYRAWRVSPAHPAAQ